MRCDAVVGYYLQYKDSGKPVEVLDRVSYAFQAEDRTCLITNPAHLAILLRTDRYRVVGVELENGAVSAPSVEREAPGVVARPRGRPRKGR